MDDKTITGLVTILLAIIGVAIIAVLVSKQSNTSNVFTAFGTSLSGALGCALSPVTGGSCGGGLMPNVTSSISFAGF